MIAYVTYDGLHPMVIAGDYKDFLQKLSVLSASFAKHGISYNDMHVEEVDVVHIDPGGILSTKDPLINFEIDGIPFSVYASKAGYMPHYIEVAHGKSTHVPGWVRFRNWQYNICLPKEVVGRLIEKLEEIDDSDEADLAWQGLGE